jgi:hypothetical protein
VDEADTVSMKVRRRLSKARDPFCGANRFHYEILLLKRTCSGLASSFLRRTGLPRLDLFRRGVKCLPVGAVPAQCWLTIRFDQREVVYDYVELDEVSLMCAGISRSCASSSWLEPCSER